LFAPEQFSMALLPSWVTYSRGDRLRKGSKGALLHFWGLLQGGMEGYPWFFLGKNTLTPFPRPGGQESFQPGVDTKFDLEYVMRRKSAVEMYGCDDLV
jgi:hypothetical protein